MSTATEMLDDLRDRLDDQGDTKFSEPTKLRYLNRGQAAMFPKIYRTARDSTIVIAADTWEYPIPSTVGSQSLISAIELEGSTLGRYFPLVNYEIIYGLADPLLKLKDASLPAAGKHIRITAAVPMTAFLSNTSAFTGPAFAEELPVLYAMSLSMAAAVERRMNYTRMPTVEGMNGTTPEDYMTGSQFWMSQFQTLLEQFTMPMPAGL